jgi:hypothetical protein
MITLAEIAAICTSRPDVTVGERYGMRTWFVGKKAFCWERPLTKADIKRYGVETPPAGPLVALIAENPIVRDSIVDEGTKGVFSIPHFASYPAFLVQLDVIAKRTMIRLINDAYQTVTTTVK